MNNILNELSMSSFNIHQILMVLIVFILIDIVTGITNAVLSKSLDSTKMKTGVVGKLYELCVVGIGMLLDRIFNLDIIAVSITIFYIAQEGLSILENTGDYISYPQILKDLFAKLKEQTDKGE